MWNRKENLISKIELSGINSILPVVNEKKSQIWHEKLNLRSFEEFLTEKQWMINEEKEILFTKRMNGDMNYQKYLNFPSNLSMDPSYRDNSQEIGLTQTKAHRSIGKKIK